ncbi:alpha-E domain-containing protein [Pseudoroseomonas wenyumeiae]
MPHPLRLRLFLMQDGSQWHILPGGLARVEAEDGSTLAKDVWVLHQDNARIAGPAAQRQPPLAIRRAAGDLPSRVADNLFWLGRHAERLEGAARLMRATLCRLDRGPLLPHEVAELATLSQCLHHAGLIAAEEQPSGAGTGPLREALLRSVQPNGAVVEQLGQVGRLVEAVRDRLTADIYATFTQPLRSLLAQAATVRGLDALEALLAEVLRYTASLAGVAAENMVRAGGYTFLDLGRRVERAQSVASQLHFALAQAPARVEAGLRLALELCDSVITYRNRYLGILQPAPALDLVLADPGNPRGLSFQLRAIQTLLADLGDAPWPPPPPRCWRRWRPCPRHPGQPGAGRRHHHPGTRHRPGGGGGGQPFGCRHPPLLRAAAGGPGTGRADGSRPTRHRPGLDRHLLRAAMNWRVRHVTTYRYAETVDMATHMLHLSPRAMPGQRVLAEEIRCTPTPSRLTQGTDHFGNRVTWLSIDQPHARFEVVAEARVETAFPPPPAADATPPWEELAARPGPEAVEFTFPRPCCRRMRRHGTMPHPPSHQGARCWRGCWT